MLDFRTQFVLKEQGAVTMNTSDITGPSADGALFHNLFFSLNPPAWVANDLWRRACRFRSRGGLSGRPTPPERLHISMNAFRPEAALNRQTVARAIAAASRVAMRPFMVKLNQLVSWNGAQRPLVLTGGDGVYGVDSLYRELHAALVAAGLKPLWRPDFQPHLTLLRDRVETRRQKVADVQWQVREFVLIHSPYGLSRHNILWRWPLLEKPKA
jgi:2'-5' RNA ligase